MVKKYPGGIVKIIDFHFYLGSTTSYACGMHGGMYEQSL